jgi:hypothetical protein
MKGGVLICCFNITQIINNKYVPPKSPSKILSSGFGTPAAALALKNTY